MSDIQVGQKVNYALEVEVDGQKQVEVKLGTIEAIAEDGSVTLQCELGASGNQLRVENVNENFEPEAVAGTYQVLPVEEAPTTPEAETPTPSEQA